MFSRFSGSTDDVLGNKLTGLLYPRESESREVKSLDGFWDFAVPPADDLQKGHKDAWYSTNLSKVTKVVSMPVPSSYNDVTTSSSLRDHVGPVWYEKTFYGPVAWKSDRIFLRFGSVNYLAEVWMNGTLITSHEVGHLPFEVEVTTFVLLGGNNRLTVAVDNTLSKLTVPQGKIVEAETESDGPVKMQTYTFDFFNYAGIHRPVLLHTKPKNYIQDISVVTEVFDQVAIIKYQVDVFSLNAKEVIRPGVKVDLYDADRNNVLEKTEIGSEGVLEIKNPKLWWPIYMDKNPGYLYTLEVCVTSVDCSKADVYRLPIGIRQIEWNNSSVLINKKPIYFRGFGKHEDAALRGRGLDLVTVARDHELLTWVGANTYRTSHYPYSEEALNLADKMGFLIIDECPSVDTDKFSSQLLKKHKMSLSELIRRDKNRPSVIMWSVANEPRTLNRDSPNYFKQIVNHVKTLDITRPVTAAIAVSPAEDRAGQYLDVISFNRYHGWYLSTGRLDLVTHRVMEEIQAWHDKYGKPVIMAEYGADTMPGLHELPEYVWSEEYQAKLLSCHFKAFDKMRSKGYFIGEFIWNFADFRTAQTYTRVGGNKKGVFTRDRQPKMAAFHVRKRYHALAAEEGNTDPPNDLENYTSSHYF
ncbi:hypothetical protein TKK_0004055 [Trichogramma kaykai]|uniref:Beta-glucuronidase n=1 Tax=Trichogramma kaykai TaxID=54128 RepID=A0ABD2XP30_9HYME